MPNDKREIKVNTPVGELIAYCTPDPDYPEIYIDLERDGYSVPLCVIMVKKSDNNKLKALLWSDCHSDYNTHEIKFRNLEDAFKEIEKKGKTNET